MCMCVNAMLFLLLKMPNNVLFMYVYTLTALVELCKLR